jgi:large subunit ribosomal protein L18
MITKKNRKSIVQKRHYRSRRYIRGTAERPRLAVFRSVKHIYAQLINDEQNITLAAASSLDADLKKDFAHGGNIDAAKAVGELVAKRAQGKGFTKVVFDRGGNIYHGRVAALADAAREAGLDF